MTHRSLPNGTCAECGQLWPCQSILQRAAEVAALVPKPLTLVEAAAAVVKAANENDPHLRARIDKLEEALMRGDGKERA